ncbi:AP-3 complex subunit sigma-1 isoform X2 [Sus scrofa]|uniref:AP-3 complex subunit sigma-1 isoform X2 n=1 Tax=Sus scrofa TaxID=9823 RepID=UPI000A2B0DEB|nr:AP-3 complex subunit sigma-1 isoform X2 [Sus scrofa]
MIKAILIFNNHGKPRLSKFYQPYSEDTQQQIIRETFHLVSKRDENVCNFLEGGLLIGGSDNKLIYRHYATLYFVFCVDSSESELGILDLIQVHNILAEMVMGGMVLETNMNEIVTQIDAQNKLEKSEVNTEFERIKLKTLLNMILATLNNTHLYLQHLLGGSWREVGYNKNYIAAGWLSRSSSPCCISCKEYESS